MCSGSRRWTPCPNNRRTCLRLCSPDPWQIFLNAPGPAVEEYPAFAGKAIGGTLTLYMEVSGVETIYKDLRERVKVTMPLEKKFYGVTEFAFEDPDGYVITFARAHGIGTGV